MIYKIADNVLSPLGNTTSENYQAVKSGRSAIQRHEGFWRLKEPFSSAFFPKEAIAHLCTEGMTPFESLVLYSIQKALEQTELDVTKKNVVLILSTTKGNIELLESQHGKDIDISPATSASRLASHLSMTTEPIAVCNACISGVAAILLAQHLLEAHCYDYAIVCGADVLTHFTVSGFQSLMACSEETCKPFDMERKGLNLGEAAATMILARSIVGNKEAWAIERGAVRNDAYHISSPSKEGKGALLALQAAKGDINNEEIAFINAHGTATLFNDQMESVAVERAGLSDVPVNSLKGYFGHTLGAAGILETVLSMAALDDHTILGTRGFAERGVSGHILLSAHHEATSRQRFIKMISGFGGCNAAMLVTHTSPKQEETRPLPTLRAAHHVILTPEHMNVDGRESMLKEGRQLIMLYKQYVNDYPRFYKMDPLCRLGFLAVEMLLQAENSQEDTADEERTVILFNHSSSIVADKAYQKTINSTREYFPSPSAFVYTLPNIVTGEIAIRHGYHNETSFYMLKEKNEEKMSKIVRATLADTPTTSAISGWLDYADESHFEADITLFVKQ